jgi:hypothetical protein
MADEIVVKYDGEVKKLEDKLRSVEAEQIAIDKQAKKTGTTITKESEKAAASVGKVSKNVNGLKDSFNTLTSNLPFAGAIQQVTQLSGAMSGLVKGTGAATNGMKVLRTAIVSTGIGALVVALIALISYFKRTDEGATKLEGIMGALGAAMDEVTGFIAELGSTIFEAFESVENFGQALKDLGNFVITNLINRFKSVLVYGEAIGLLFKGEFAAATKKAADGLIQMNTGIENGTDKFDKFADRIAKAAEEAYNFAVQMDAISDAQRDLNVELSANRILVVELIKQSKNHSLSLSERITKLQQANALDAEGLAKTLELETKKLDLLKKRNQREKDSINQRLNEQIKEARSEEEIIKLKQKSLSINDNLAQEEADQIIKINGLKVESVALQERNNSAIASLKEQAIAEELELEKRKNTQIENLEKQRFLDGEISAQELADKQEDILIQSLKDQRNILEKYSKDLTEINKAILDAEIKASQDKNIKKIDHDKEFNDEMKSLSEQAGQELIALAFEVADGEIAANEKKKEAIKKQEEEIKALKKQALMETIAVSEALLNAYNEKKLNDITAEINKELAANKTKTDSLIENLQKRKETGLLTESQYNAQRQRILDKAAKKEDDLKRKQFEANKKAEKVSAGINVAASILKTLAVYGFTPAAAIAIAADAALAAVQIAAIDSKKYPGFKKGVLDLQGKGTGTSDSIHAMLSKGESVMTAEETKEHKPLFTAIRNKKFEKYAYENIARPAIKRELERQRKKEDDSQNLMRLIASSEVDTSHLERLTKSNKNVNIGNYKALANELANVIQPKPSKGI